MPDKETLKKLSHDMNAHLPKFQKHVSDEPSTNDLLRELITEFKGLRADIRRKELLPDTPFVRRIIERLNR